jgi:hypothetical protein
MGSPMTEIGHCKDCRHWSRPNQPLRDGDFGCVLVQINLSGGLIREDRVYWRTGGPRGAEGLLRFGPDFGCIHFARKDPTLEGRVKVLLRSTQWRTVYLGREEMLCYYADTKKGSGPLWGSVQVIPVDRDSYLGVGP